MERIESKKKFINILLGLKLLCLKLKLSFFIVAFIIRIKYFFMSFRVIKFFFMNEFTLLKSNHLFIFLKKLCFFCLDSFDSMNSVTSKFLNSSTCNLKILSIGTFNHIIGHLFDSGSFIIKKKCYSIKQFFDL